MAQRSISPNARRLRWALLIALALHALLLARYAPDLLTRLDAATASTLAVAEEQIVELAPLTVPPKPRGMSLSTRLGQVSQQPLPAGFYDKPAPRAVGAMQLSGDLDFSRASGLQIVANIIPSAINLPNIQNLREKPRAPTTALKPLATLKPLPPSPLADAAREPATTPSPTPPPTVTPDAPPLQAVIELAPEPATPLLPPPEEADSYDVEASIVRAAEAAEQQARAAHAAAVAKTAPDYRALLPQGAVVSPAPLPLGGNKPTRAPGAAEEPDSSITTYALSPVAPRSNERPPDAGRLGIARQQFLTQLAARLKTTNVQMLAQALKAGPRTTVQMKFLVDRSGLVLEISAAEPANRLLIERAAAVIRAANLPRVPDAMTQVPVELSFPVEVYQ